MQCRPEQSSLWSFGPYIETLRYTLHIHVIHVFIHTHSHTHWGIYYVTIYTCTYHREKTRHKSFYNIYGKLLVSVNLSWVSSVSSLWSARVYSFLQGLSEAVGRSLCLFKRWDNWGTGKLINLLEAIARAMK